MPKLPRAVPIPPLHLRLGFAPLHRQLYNGLREMILEGRLQAGAQLPSTRTLAHALGVSRTTVLTAYEQLLAEGYLAGKVGSGTFVAHILPDDLLTLGPLAAVAVPHTTTIPPLSRRGMLLATTPFSGMPAEGGSRALRPGMPALDQFPIQIWGRLEARLRRTLSHRLLGYHDPAGYQPLREAIASYFGAARGLRCEAGQVIIVNGSAQALDLAARVLLDPGDAVWIEDPCYVGARGAFTSAGARLIPVPVDPEGLDVARAILLRPDARLAYVTPSRQYPVGVTLSLARRLALIEWAARSQAWVVEDDYDNEYRYVGRPLAALQGLDRANRVLYVGTFSKVLFPALRLGYLVVPPALVDAFASARALADRGSPVFEQAVLAEFLHEGHFARHIRRMRRLYGERQAVLIDAAGRELAGRLDVRPAEAGMHLVGWLQDGVDDQGVSARAGAHGVEAPALSRCRITPGGPGGLLLGYTAFTGEEIRAAVRRLAMAFGA